MPPLLLVEAKFNIFYFFKEKKENKLLKGQTKGNCRMGMSTTTNKPIDKFQSQNDNGCKKKKKKELVMLRAKGF